MGDLREHTGIGDDWTPSESCPTKDECVAADWCQGGCGTTKSYMETFQPVTLHFDPNCTLADYETIVSMLTAHPAVSKLDVPTAHNLSVAVRKKRRGEP